MNSARGQLLAGEAGALSSRAFTVPQAAQTPAPATVRKPAPPTSRAAALDGPSPMPAWGVNLRDASAGETLEVRASCLFGPDLMQFRFGLVLLKSSKKKSSFMDVGYPQKKGFRTCAVFGSPPPPYFLFLAALLRFEGWAQVIVPSLLSSGAFPPENNEWLYLKAVVVYMKGLRRQSVTALRSPSLLAARTPLHTCCLCLSCRTLVVPASTIATIATSCGFFFCPSLRRRVP